ncbi:MAG: ABC transporter ATP-binding protein [Thermoprotei archaeon]
MALLEVKNLKTYYHTTKGINKAVDNVGFSVEKGEALGIAGESGCGKSTLAQSIIRLVPPPGKIVSGEVIFQNVDIIKMDESELNKKVRWKGISMVFQGSMNSLNPVYTVGYQLIEPLIYHQGMDKTEAISIAEEKLKLVGLNPEIIKRYPHELSGGMKQRVAIAMALMLNPPLLIADEPTTALDVVVQAQIMNLLKELQTKLNLSLIFITHDLSLIAEVAHKTAIMYAGKIVEIGKSESIFYNPLHPYTKKLLGSIPRLRGEIRKLEFIPGVPPDLRTPPPGCRFHPRCPFVMDICRKEEPPLIEVESNHYAACWLYGGK